MKRPTLTTRSMALIGSSGLLVYGAAMGRPIAYVVPLMIAVLAIIAFPIGIRRHRPRQRVGWWLLLAGVILHWLGALSWVVTDAAVYSNGRLGLPNLLHVLAYLCLGLGALSLLGRRRFRDDPAEALDALVITAAIGVAGWGLVLRPLSQGIALDSGATALLTVYPLIALATVGCATQLWLASSGTKNVSMRLVVAALASLLIANIAQSAIVLGDGETWNTGAIIGIRLAFLILIAMAVLHPSMASTSVLPSPTQQAPRWRFALLTALAAIAPLGVVLADTLLGRATDYRGLFIGTLILFATVVLRLGFLGRSLNRSSDRVRTLNTAGNRLVQALTIEQIHEVARAAVRDILNSPDVSVWLVTDETLCHQRGGGLYDENGVRTVRVLKPGHPVHAYFGVDDSVYFVVVPLDTSVAGSNQLAISTEHSPSRAARTTMIQLSDSVAHAIDRVRYAERAAEQESDQRLHRLLHDASDVIAVLDADLILTYVTPAVARLLGLGSRTLVGTSWIDLVHPDDRALAERALRTARSARTSRTELRLVADDGGERYVEMTSSRYEDESGGGFTVSCHDFTRRHELEQQLKHQAFHDALTGLANRSLLQDRLRHAVERSQRTGKEFAVLFADLDDFKNVNDSLGHAIGDSLLRTVARRLRATLRSQDTAARLGGDEFAILIEDVGDHEEVERVASRIVQALAEPVRISGAELLVAASIGVAYGSGRTKDVEDVMRNADLALYEAKGSGKNRYAVFQPEMHENAVGKMQLTADMRRGIARNEFVVHFQPLVDLRTDQIIGVEALARWNHPEKGLLSPAHFVSLAEETGLVVPLGREILEGALLEAGRWQDLVGPELLVAVNLSGRQLVDSCIVDDVKFALSVSGVAPESLLLEITESVLLPGEGVMADRLRELADLGVRLYIDDFGTGYSSLSYLRQLPVRGIKLAREFVATLPGTDAETGLVRTILDLAKTLELDDVVAEGIETQEQRDALVDLGFRIGQGYLLARPRTAEQMHLLLLAQTRKLAVPAI